MYEILEPFKVPLYKTVLSLDTKQIKLYCKKIQKNDKGLKISNRGGYHSNNLTGSHFPLNELFKNIEYHSNIFSKKCNFKNKVNIISLWININSNNHSNEAHTHTNTKFSGVYYVNTPKDCGNIVFHNPAYDTMIYDWNENYNEFNGYNSCMFDIPVQENILYIFPGWLKHNVKPNLSKKERISISFNCN